MKNISKISLAAILLFIVAGCAGDNNSSPSKDDTSSLPNTVQTESEPAPSKSGLTIEQVNPDGSTVDITPKITTETLPPKASVDELTKGIVITKDGFSPSEVTLKVGGKVIFQNLDDQEHWPASDPHPVHSIEPGLDPKKGLKKDEFFEYTFTKAGTYPFHDHLHSSWRGVITVTE